MACIQRLAARVTLDDPQPALEAAEHRAASGDESWGQWVTEYRRGMAIIVRLAVTLEVSDRGGEVVETANRGVFLETDRQPPLIEQQVAELVSKDFSALARELIARGHNIDRTDLHDMYVHVELGDDVRRSLLEAEARSQRPSSDARLSRHENPPSDLP